MTSKIRTTLQSPALVVVLAAVAALSSSCTILYLLNEDPDGLPCEIDDDGITHCLKGYTCVDKNDGSTPLCRKAGALQVGQACDEDAQCDEDLVCDTGYTSCADNPDDPNCSIVPSEQKDKACRLTCSVNDPDTCPADTLCFQNGDHEFCQAGTCATDSDCQEGFQGLCVGETVLGGKTGFCFQRCDPLRCAGGVCADCTGLDGVADPGLNCIAVLDEGLSARAMCDSVGDLQEGDTCDPVLDRCELGAFCNAAAGAALGRAPFCTRWCSFPSGAPACNSPTVCTQVSGNLGFCG